VTDARNSLVITGGHDDVVTFKAADWTHGNGYDVYQGGGATVSVQQQIQVEMA